LESIPTFSTREHFIEHQSSAINSAMFVKSGAICDIREMVPLCIEYLTAVKKLTSLDCRVKLNVLSVVFLFHFY